MSTQITFWHSDFLQCSSDSAQRVSCSEGKTGLSCVPEAVLNMRKELSKEESKSLSFSLHIKS